MTELNDFSEAAEYYDLVFAARGKDYEAEAAAVECIVRERDPKAKTLLDVACGTGRHLVHFSRNFEAVGIDADASMLAIAKRRVPAVPLETGDMRAFRLGRTFDAIVCMFGSVTYAGGSDGLTKTVRTMREHLAPGGVIVIEPFVGPGEYQTGQLSVVNVDLPDLKLARMHVSARAGNTAILDHHFLVAKRDGARHFVERHELALLDDGDYAAAFAAAGLQVARVAHPALRLGVFVSRL
jgi:SAM-dependent methyltransferase